MRKKDKTKPNFSPPRRFSRLNFSPLFLNLQPPSPQSPKVARDIGEWGLQSVHNTLSLLLHSFLLCCGSLPWDAVPVKLFQCGSSTQAVALQKLYQHGSSLWVHSRNGLLHHGPPWAALPAPLWALHRLQPSSEHIHLLRQGLPWCAPPWAAGGQPAPFVGSSRISAPAPGMPSCCSPSLTLVSVGLFLSHFSCSSPIAPG